MAFTSQTFWNVQNGGADNSTGNGGGFDTGVAGMATDGAATVATSAAPVFTSATYTFVAGDVGHWVYIKSGTDWIPGWYLIASVSLGAATLTATIGTATQNDGGLNVLTGCATVASPTGATWSVDYSRSTTVGVTFTDMVIDGATNTDFTSAANPVTVNMIGNIIAVSSGVGFTVQRLAIASIPSGVIGRCERSLGTLASTGGNGKLGGCYASPGYSASQHASGHTIFIKYNATPFTATSTTINVANGRLFPAAGTVTRPSRVQGYEVTPGDLTANRPTYRWGVNAGSLTLISTGSVANVVTSNMILSGDRAGGWTGTTGYGTGGSQNIGFRLKVMSCVANGIILATGIGPNMLIDVEVTDCTTVAAVGWAVTTGVVHMIGCNIHDNLSHGVDLSTGGARAMFVDSIFANNNSGAGAGSAITGNGAGNTLTMDHCVVYGSGSHGVNITTISAFTATNCLFEANGGYAINPPTSAVNGSITLLNNSFYNNTSGNYPADTIPSGRNLGEINAASTMFQNAAGNDFRLNNTSGGGLSSRAASYITTFPGSSTPNYRDRGAAQNQSSGSMAFGFAG